MPSNNQIIVASAGSGKTTSIVIDADKSPDSRIGAISYTRNSRSEIVGKAFEELGYVPSNLRVDTWYSFLLRHFIRPYQRCLYQPRVGGLCFVNGSSAKGIAERNVPKHYFAAKGKIYTDKVSKFACKAIAKTDGLPISRFEKIFDRLIIDECQDLAGYDLELIERLFASNVDIILVGDHRQATYSTNNNRKNKKFSKSNIIEKFLEWKKSDLCEIEYQNVSYRCVQSICEFADALNPDLPKTKSLNQHTTFHDGMFAVRKSDVDAYLQKYNPQTLRYSRAQKHIPGHPFNFGEAKGMTFERTLIFPHRGFAKFVSTGKLEDAGKEIAKIYVAVTRAKQSTAIVVDDKITNCTIPIWEK